MKISFFKPLILLLISALPLSGFTNELEKFDVANDLALINVSYQFKDKVKLSPVKPKTGDEIIRFLVILLTSLWQLAFPLTLE